MKTTIDMQDDLLSRAKQHARQTGLPLRAVVEEGLRMLLDAPPQSGYTLPDLSVGNAGRRDPLEQCSWPELRSIIYSEPESDQPARNVA